jgi:2-polyprenyl-3-methyl-5-hydroxy-6-metoxy-1,4-benzoquinol methylase
MQTVPTEPSVCPVCGPAPHHALFNATDRLHGLDGQFSYDKCDGCGLVYMNPRVRPDSAMRVYPTTYQPHAASEVRSAKPTLSNQVQRWLRGIVIPAPIKSQLGPSSRVLDVGFGAGEFLNEIRAEHGCRVFGLDLSEAAVKFARERFDIDAFHGSLAEAPWPPGSFDFITCWWSLEHMPDPEAALAKIHELLAPGGHVLVAVPNSRSAVASLFRDRWYHLDCPRHYHLWTPDSLRKLLEKNALRHVTTNFDKSPWGLMGSLQYVVYGDNHRPEAKDRLRGNMLLAPLFLPLTFPLGLLKRGDTMVMCAQKVA